jgi:hypothetical protein
VVVVVVAAVAASEKAETAVAAATEPARECLAYRMGVVGVTASLLAVLALELQA